MTETGYPLAWPIGRSRTTSRQAAKFGKVRETQYGKRIDSLTIADALERLQGELARLGAVTVVISSNLKLRLDGLPLSKQAEPIDPGVAVYFTLFGKRTVLSCDRWTKVADNIAAIAAHIECLRGIDRYGVGTLEQAFRGYLALENFSGGIPWRRVLGLKDDDAVTLDMVNAKYRELIRRYHTDIAGGDHTQAAQLNQAIAQARAELGGEGVAP